MAEHAVDSLFAGPGDVRELCRGKDWTTTPLGAVEGWPEALRFAVRLCLDSATPMAVWSGPDLALIYNDGYPPVLGPLKHPWALGRPGREVWPEFWDRLGPQLRQVVERAESTRYEDARFVLRRRGGKEEETFFTYTFVPVREHDGRVVGVLNIFDETTDRVRRALERAAELQTVLDLVPAAVWIARDPQASRIDANRFGAELLERPRGANVSVTGPPAERPLNFRPMRDGAEIAPDDLPIQAAARRGVTVRDCEFDLVFEDGRVRHLLGNAAPLRDTDGRVAGSVGAFIDITARKQTEEALREASRQKDEFVAMLSHELRNPLAPIMNSLYILDHAAPGGEQARRAHQVIARQAAHLSSLVNALLDASRLSRHLVQLRRELLEIDEVVGGAVDDHRTLFDEAGIALDFRPSPRPIYVRADATRLAQVIGNLLHNAVKFTGAGGHVRVLVELEAEEALVRVADDGAGIAPELLARLSQPFTQLSQGLDRSKGGLGLGLALARSLVELHGGQLLLHSDGPRRGTEVAVRLPLATGVMSPRPASFRPRAEPRRILVIEDNHDAATSLRETLELWGHEVVVAHDGQDGIECARTFRPDVVLCDIGLPGTDGYAVARALRADGALAGLRLVALSGYARGEDLERARAAGFERHLSKPPGFEDLAAALA